MYLFGEEENFDNKANCYNRKERLGRIETALKKWSKREYNAGGANPHFPLMAKHGGNVKCHCQSYTYSRPFGDRVESSIWRDGADGSSLAS